MPTMRSSYITDSTAAALHSLHLFTATLVDFNNWCKKKCL